jgi:hypothetical protein
METPSSSYRSYTGYYFLIERVQANFLISIYLYFALQFASQVSSSFYDFYADRDHFAQWRASRHFVLKLAPMLSALISSKENQLLLIYRSVV